MGKVTPSMAKNAIRRALLAEIERPLSNADKTRIWQYFESSCAYCGRRMDPIAREGHMDHLESHSSGGDAHISNTVLACRFCNGDEKRETHWLDFLKQKCPDDSTLNARRQRIEEWVRTNSLGRQGVSSELRNEVERQAVRAVAAFDEALAEVRRSKRAAG